MLAILVSLFGKIGVGGLLRFVPQVFKLLSDKGDRDHEYRMAKLQLEIDAARAGQQIDLVHAQGSEAQATTSLQAYVEALKGQSEIKSGVPIADALNVLVRPIITYWLLGLYTIYKVAVLVNLVATDAALSLILGSLWTAADADMMGIIFGFWFVDRVFRKQDGK